MAHDHFGDSAWTCYQVYDDELDLSYEDIEEVPIEFFKCYSKVSIVDLSHNNIERLPNEFALCFENLQNLDLSYNSISNLPENFKTFINLRHLDLSFNEFRRLDIWMSGLKNLEWLNLTGNKLIPILREVIAAPWGVDEKYSCAKSVVQFFTQVQDAFPDSGVSRKKSNADFVDTRVEVLFSRTKAQMTANERVLVEDHNGQFFYVTFGKSVKDLRQKGSEKELSTGKMLSQTVVKKSQPESTGIVRNIKRMIRTVLGITILISLCTTFLALTVYPENLKKAFPDIMESLPEMIILPFLQYHSWIHEKFQYFSIFPVSPPLPPPEVGFWEWLAESISGLYYSLFRNYRAKP